MPNGPRNAPPTAGLTRGLRSALMTAALSMGGGRTVVVVRGEADVSNRPVVCDMLCRLIALQVGDVVIDLAEVTAIDTASVRALAMGYRLLNGQNRKLTFRSPSGLTAQMLQLFELSDLIETPENAFDRPRKSTMAFAVLPPPAVRMDGERTVVVLRGGTDVSTRPVLCDVLSRVVASGPGDVVIDLAEVRFIDTATARVLATAQQLLDGQNRKLTFRSPSRLAA